MKHMRIVWLAGCVAIGLMLTTGAVAGDRTAEEILSDYQSVERPTYNQERRGEEGYIQEFRAELAAAQEKQAALILELYTTHPDHERVVDLMPVRWQTLMGNDEHAETMAAEIAAVIKKDPAGKLADEARYSRAMMSVQTHLWPAEEKDRDVKTAKRDINAFIDAAPADDRGARLLNYLARAYKAGTDEQLAVYMRIKDQYPGSTGAKYADGKIRQAKSLGKPFELAFTDAITGTEITMRDLRGQVVVIDFWATWCGPCVAEMPTMKELYQRYHDEGVEFVGISLDQPEENGGLTKLKEYVKENEIPWPQYYQGKGWDGEFSVAWGINSIPALFIIDKKGNLHSTAARGKLEELIPKLLAD